MGESDRYQDYRKLARRRFTLGQPDNALFALFALNLVVFFFILLSRVFYLNTHQGQGEEALAFDALHWFALPANLSDLAQKPWTILSFMFAQGGTIDVFPLLLLLLTSMLWLWAFGHMLQDLAGNKYLFPLYIYGSIIGAIVFIAVVNLVPAWKMHSHELSLFGPAAGTASVAIAVTTFSPGYRLFRHIGNGIPVWVVTGLYLLIHAIYAFGQTSVQSFAVLGGGLAGFLFVVLLRKGVDTAAWMINFYQWISNLFTPDKVVKMKGAREKVFYNTGNRKPFNRTANVTQQRIDEILDKINSQGYHLLTDEEKNILKRAGEEEL